MKIVRPKILQPSVDPLKDLYYEIKGNVQEDIDIHQRDIMENIVRYIDNKIKHGELINIGIRGEPGTGKSVVGLWLQNLANRRLEHYFNKTIDDYPLIASDQNEFLRLSKIEEENICCLIDEWNPMAKTGANATTEQAEFEFFTDLCRVYYLHRISCNPTNVIDKNCHVIFDVIGKNTKDKTTDVKVLYRNTTEGQLIALGVATFPIEKIIKSKVYKKYEEKKKMRTDLLKKEGVRDVRELEFAQVSINVIRKLQDMIKTDQRVELDYAIKMTITIEMQTLYKRPISWVAEDEIAKPVKAILVGMKSIHKHKNPESKQYNPQIVKINEELVGTLFNNLKHKAELLQKYYSIGDKE